MSSSEWFTGRSLRTAPPFRRPRARVLLLSDDRVCGVAASGVLARVRRAWLVDGVGELLLDRGGGSSGA